MYFQKKARQRIGAAMAVAMVLGNSVSAAAAPVHGEGELVLWSQWRQMGHGTGIPRTI